MLTTPSLRPYQQQVVREVYNHIRSGLKRILVVAATGSGKTIISAQIVADAASRGRRILFIVHRDMLVSQTYDKFQKFGLECGFIKAGWAENRNALVQIASVQTLPRRQWWYEFAADVIVLDEAHITGFSAVTQKVLEDVYPVAIYLGLTATPWRLSKREAMGDIFDAVVAAPMPHELIDQGFLVKPSYFGVKSPNLDGVKTLGGDYSEPELARVCDHPDLNQQIVLEWQRLAAGRRTIVFAVDVQHSQNLYQAFHDAGISSAHVDGTTPTRLRQKIYGQLARGQILILCSCETLTEGFDCPAVCAVCLCRPTKSKALYFQQVGRGLRLSPETEKQDCVVLDQAGNISKRNFGFIEDLKTINLLRGRDSELEEAPKKECPECSALLYTFQMQCKCGYEFPREMVPFLQALIQLLSEEDRKRLKEYHTLYKQAYRESYAPGWAAVQFKEKYGHWPPKAWTRGAVFGEFPTQANREEFEAYLCFTAERKQRTAEWVEHYMKAQFG